MAFSFRINERKAIFVLVDFLLLVLSVFFALKVWSVRGGIHFDFVFIFSQVPRFLYLPILWVIINLALNTYSLYFSADIRRSIRALFSSFIIILLIYMVIYFFSPPKSLPRGIVLYHGSASLLLMILWRWIYYWLARGPTFKRRALVMGSGEMGRIIVGALQQHLNLHYELIGFIDDHPEKEDGERERGREEDKIASPWEEAEGHVLKPPGLSVLGTSRDLLRLIRDHKVSEIVLAVKNGLTDDCFRALLASQEQGVSITLMPILYEQITGRVPVEHIGQNWYIALPLDNPEASGFYPIFKRILDLVVACVGMSLFVLLFPLIYLAIRVDSKGPVFYSQTRVGKRGQPFRVWKLRTMVVDAEKNGEVRWASRIDPRITRVGKWLRRTRVDEFPQFLNILNGEMSAVGPRPERPEFISELENAIPFYRLRHAVKPGMAGWAMVHQDYAGTIEDALVRLQYDLYYIKHQSIRLDIFILLQTLGRLVALKGR